MRYYIKNEEEVHVYEGEPEEILELLRLIATNCIDEEE